MQQLPASRRAIVTLLKAGGPATIAQLAPQLSLTGEAVRQQLLQLHRDGWIEPVTHRQEPRLRTGRPATAYRLSEAGENLFPKHYDDLIVALLDATDEVLGTDAALRVLEHLAEVRVRAFGPSVAGRTLEEKTEALRNWYGDGDPWMERAMDGNDFRLVERNCPFYNTAMRRPIICTVSINALSRTLGVRVDREETFQNGDGRCVFRVHTHEPVDPDHWPLRAD